MNLVVKGKFLREMLCFILSELGYKYDTHQVSEDVPVTQMYADNIPTNELETVDYFRFIVVADTKEERLIKEVLNKLEGVNTACYNLKNSSTKSYFGKPNATMKILDIQNTINNHLVTEAWNDFGKEDKK